MAGEFSGEFQDWELLVNSDADVVSSPNSMNNNNNSRNFEQVEDDSDGVLRLDYFSLEHDNRYAKPAVVYASDEGSVQSDNPSWIDPGPEPRYNQINNPGEFWSDSSSDRSDERKVGELDVKHELGFADNVKTEGRVDGIGEIDSEVGKDEKFASFESSFSNLVGKNEMGFEKNMENEVKIELDKDLGKKNWFDSGDNNLILNDISKTDENSEISGESNVGDGSKEENLSVVAAGEKKPEGDEEKRKVVWWKVPFELLRYCVFRINPVWTFSMAAAVMGFVILGRRLYKMKRKTRSLQLKVTVDDKKVSQFTSRAARLNEAFSVVRRVPIVRPLLPAAGVNTWPAMTLR